MWFETRCRNAAQCRKIYLRIMQRCVKAAPAGFAAFDRKLQTLLEAVPSPDRALVHLDRFLESSFSPSSMLEDFIRSDGLLDGFLRLVTGSTFLADVLVRDAELFRWLALSGVLSEEKPREYFHASAQETVDRFAVTDRRVTSLRRYQRRELLRIAARDILRSPGLERTVRELSWLADSILATLLTESRRLATARFGVDPETRIAIIGLGKLGGEELNYSSDIDLMVAYDENRALNDAMDTHAFVVHTIETLTGFLTQQTSEGFFYRTDYRLRPDGNAGPIAVSLHGMLAYYESRGALWERQMLLKARIVAGDGGFGAQALAQLLPFTFPRTLAVTPTVLLEDIQSRVSQRWNALSNIKHGRGGIRQIEFCTQALQLLNGGGRPDLHTPNTRRALRELNTANLLSTEEYTLLDEAYVFLRRIEHFLQLETFDQTHELPSDDEHRRIISWLLDFESTSEFDRELGQTREGVARLWDGIFSPAAKTSPPKSWSFDAQTLAALGFANPETAGKIIHTLVAGRNSRPHNTQFRARIQGLLPSLLTDIANGLFPERTLKTVEAGFDRVRAPEALLDFCSVSGSRRFLLQLASGMPVLFLSACGNPLVFDSIFSGAADSPVDALPMGVVKLMRETNICGRYLLQELTIQEFLQELSSLADYIVKRMYAELIPDQSTAPFVILALGKYGGRELSPGSDLDVVFLFEEREGWRNEDAQNLAARFIASSQGSIEAEKLYTVDARLRPEGRSSPLAVSITAYEHYLHRRASLWEKQSLLKARVVSGSSELAERVQSLIMREVTGQEMSVAQLDEILSMRRKMEPENRFRTPHFFDVKLSSGGLVDAEFAVQAVQLVLGRVYPELLSSNTFDAMDAIERVVPELSRHCTILRERFVFLRRFQILMRTLLDSPSNLLPSDTNALNTLAAATGFATANDVLVELENGRKTMRKEYSDVVAFLQGVNTASNDEE